jgi:quercetin dioxygenase-like cupin family protein
MATLADDRPRSGECAVHLNPVCATVGSTPEPAGIAAGQAKPGPGLALAAAALGFFMITLDALVVNVALPAIGRELGAGIAGLQWVVDGYTLMFAALLLSGGALADRIGARRVYGVGLALFVAASLACGLAPTIGVLVAARLVQGVGAAAMMPASLALIREAYEVPMGNGQRIEITPSGSRPSAKGSPQHFTGSVVIDPLFVATEHTHATGSLVTFEPGARTAWHTHPAGQNLIVTSGTGWVQEWGGAKREIRPGDVIWIPPGVKHWHGATAANRMSHIAITNVVDGRNVEWLEQVTDEEYGADPVAGEIRRSSPGTSTTPAGSSNSAGSNAVSENSRP